MSRRSFIICCIKGVKYLFVFIISICLNYPKSSRSQDNSENMNISDNFDDPNFAIDGEQLKKRVNEYVNKLIKALEADGKTLTEQEKEKMIEQTYENIKNILENKKGTDLEPLSPPQNLRIIEIH